MKDLFFLTQKETILCCFLLAFSMDFLKHWFLDQNIKTKVMLASCAMSGIVSVGVCLIMPNFLSLFHINIFNHNWQAIQLFSSILMGYISGPRIGKTFFEPVIKKIEKKIVNKIDEK